ncbi:hypothetical protein ACFWFB_33675 [Streptomyces albidoflavus]
MFTLGAADCTLVLGRVGDFVGRRRIFTIGMVVLAVSSLLGGVADTPAMLRRSARCGAWTPSPSPPASPPQCCSACSGWSRAVRPMPWSWCSDLPDRSVAV